MTPKQCFLKQLCVGFTCGCVFSQQTPHYKHSLQPPCWHLRAALCWDFPGFWIPFPSRFLTAHWSINAVVPSVCAWLSRATWYWTAGRTSTWHLTLDWQKFSAKEQNSKLWKRIPFWSMEIIFFCKKLFGVCLDDPYYWLSGLKWSRKIQPISNRRSQFSVCARVLLE